MPLSTRPFGRTGRNPTAIGLGAWAIGGTWGEVTDAQARDTLNAALDAGISFIDTADVYGDGRSERRIAEVLATRSGPRPFIATKAGRRSNPHTPESYNLATLEGFIDRSRANLRMDTLDLLQLHCPPTPVYGDPRVHDALETLKARGKIAQYGVSVQTIDEAMTAIKFPGVVSVQIIYNLFRQRPADRFFAAARAANVAVIARVPLASGLLTGKMTAASTFAADDHRTFNRNGEYFDKGETFSGVPFDVALQAVEELRPLVPANTPMAAFALRWILMADAISVVIPGAKSPVQALANTEADALPPLDDATMAKAREIYQRLIAPHVAHLW
jgi:aryl-alcohol dehydrogenase-like predicted oxidoreductase